MAQASRAPSGEHVGQTDSAALRSEEVAENFRGYLRQLRRCSLRAFHVDIDTRRAGRVTYTDFARACRRLGPSIQARLVWRALHGGDGNSSLNFEDIDPEEAENAELLVQAMATSCGFDIDAAWSRLIGGDGGVCSLPKFMRGVTSLGYTGDAALLFDGLDASGLGRLRREDFEYLGRFTRMGRSVLRTPAGSDPSTPLAKLMVWARAKWGGADGLLTELGADLDSQEGLRATICCSRLALILTALGFTGGALEAATRAARFGDGVSVVVEDLRCLLSGQNPRHGSAPARSPRKPLMAGSGAGRPLTPWNKHVCNFAEQNEHMCKNQRFYFNPPPLVPVDDPRLSPRGGTNEKQHAAVAKVGRDLQLDEETQANWPPERRVEPRIMNGVPAGTFGGTFRVELKNKAALAPPTMALPISSPS